MKLPKQTEIVWRIFDPEVGGCCSGRSIDNSKSVWFDKTAAIIARSSMPEEVRDRLVIKRFALVELQEE